MNKLFTLIGMFCCLMLNAQTENALQFDNIDDEVIVTNASSLIAGSSNISMSCWVNPQNTSFTFPDYDGYCGFRNDTNADFYFVQVNATHVESRFRNSLGQAFTLNNSVIQTNAWQHLVLTYDGSYLRFYYNGIINDSIAASGTITDSTKTFYIGDLLYAFNNFYFKGAFDEVSLWNITLQPSDIECIYKSYIDSTASGLQLYYKFNQGIAGGSNIGQDTLNPSAGNLPGILNNFAYSGLQSNWVAGKQNFSNATDVICPGSPYTFGSQTITAPGLYYEPFTSATGCDSLVRLILYPVLSDSVVIYADSLLAYQSNAVYQWLDCNNGNAPLSGATNRALTSVGSGDYAVAISYNNCTDTSDCINFTNVSIQKYENDKSLIAYPNPVNDVLTFRNKLLNASIEISDLSGRIVYSKNNFNGNAIDLSLLQSGNYFITIRQNEKSSLLRITKR